MASAAGSTGKKRSEKRSAGAAARRREIAAQRTAAARRAARRRRWARWGGAVAAALLLGAGVTFLVTRGGDASRSALSAAVVGGDLHSVAVVGDALYVGGHAGVGVSRDGGRQWQQVDTLEGADPMGWAVTSDTVLVGGHPGLFRSTDNGTTFARVTGAGAVPDAHALGGAGTTFYLGSPQAGLMVSTDGGRSWQVRNAQAGRSFMGSILVDPKDPQRLIAPDMSAGLTVSGDGGRTWKPLTGSPPGAMSAAWNPADTRQLIAVGSNGGARSSDGGTTWQQLNVPTGVSAVTYDEAGTVLYAAALDGERARTYRSTDGGATWAPTA